MHNWEHEELKALYNKLEMCFREACALRDKDSDIIFWEAELDECAKTIEKAQGNLAYLLNPPDHNDEGNCPEGKGVFFPI